METLIWHYHYQNFLNDQYLHCNIKALANSAQQITGRRNFYETEIIAVACLKTVHVILFHIICKVYSRNEESFNCFVTTACIIRAKTYNMLLSKR